MSYWQAWSPVLLALGILRPCRARKRQKSREARRGQEIELKLNMKTSVKDVRTLSSEKPKKPRAIGKLDHRYWGLERRCARENYGLQDKTEDPKLDQTAQWWRGGMKQFHLCTTRERHFFFVRAFALLPNHICTLCRWKYSRMYLFVTGRCLFIL